ncbi:MAG: pantoate--beta-alanine ligase [Candidatus Brocadiales bacterium]
MAEVIKKIEDMKKKAGLLRARAQTVGFVPTMGALHEGHLSLIRRARAENDVLIVSIFVNPAQFDKGSDFRSYPRQFESDLAIASQEGVDVVFAPDGDEMYPAGHSNHVEVTGGLTKGLCGASRPGHFRGVATVVEKLFDIVRPDRAYFGRKDYQQAVIVKRLVRDFGFDIDVVVLPTVREPDGLAISSRNQNLSDNERQKALSIYRALARASELYDSGERDTKVIGREMRNILNEWGITRIDYISVVDPETLEDVEATRAGVVVAIAAWVGDTRLIDNMALGVGSERQLFLDKAHTV